VRVVNLARALDRLKQAGFWCVGLDGTAHQAIHEADLSGKVALVLGAEGEGLRRLTREHCDLMVRIPIAKGMESLNVSNAAAVALYELARRL
jgi:23S rRNA (guanosine2251-2'-O)-methyltransferase